MTNKQNILISTAVLLLIGLLFFILVSEHGLADLIFLKKEHQKLVEKNARLARENLTLGVEINRLKHDPAYIENVARQELGMIGQDEVILKPQGRPGPKK